MPPKGKSSASSATRKKHARKAAAAHGGVDHEPQEKKPRGKDKKEKKDKKEPRKKVYIPPVKPAPIRPDPLNTLGLAQKLPPELLVVLRLLSKKDATTKRRALEELQSGWVSKAQRGGEDEYLRYVLRDVIPVWLHHLPTLFLNPSRRIRLLSVGLHASLLQIVDLRKEIFFQIREVAPSDHAESILGTWCLAVHDVDRQVSSFARESWSRYVTIAKQSDDTLLLDGPLFSALWELIQRVLLDPGGVYLYLNPPQPIIPTPAPSRKGSGRGTPVRRDDETHIRLKADEEEEDEHDRKARLRIGAFGATEWVLSGCFCLLSGAHVPVFNVIIIVCAFPDARFGAVQEAQATEQADETAASPEQFLSPLGNHALWSSLYHGKTPPFVDAESFGFGQPVVRKSAWGLLQTLLQRCRAHCAALLPVLSSAVLRSAWVEPDPLVRSAMWQPLLMFLKEYPNAWLVEAQADREEDGESDSGDSDDEKGSSSRPAKDASNGPSHAFTEFLQFLSTGCSGSPVQGYPTVLIILSTIPPSIIASSSAHPLEDIFTSFWAAIDARVLNSLDRAAASAAFLSSVLEALVFFVRRLLNSPESDAASLLAGSNPSESIDLVIATEGVVKDQISRTWEELSSGRLKVAGREAGGLLARTLSSLYKLRPELFEVAWQILADAVQRMVVNRDDAVSTLMPEVLKQLSEELDPATAPGQAARNLVSQVMRNALDQCAVLLQTDEIINKHVESFIKILDTFGEHVFADAEVSKRVDDLVQKQTHRILVVIPSLLLLYLKYRRDDDACAHVWHLALQNIAAYPDEIDLTLPVLLAADEKNAIPTHLQSQGELDEAAGGLLTDALSGLISGPRLSLVRKLLYSSDAFVTRTCRENLLRSLVEAFDLHLDSVLHDEKASVQALTTPLDLIGPVSEGARAAELLESVASSLLPPIYLFAFLLPQLTSVEEAQRASAQKIWERVLSFASGETRSIIFTSIRQSLQELLTACTARPTAKEILRAASQSSDVASNMISDIFPSQEDLSAMLDDLPSTPLDPSLAVIDPLVPPPTLYRTSGNDALEYDSRGLSKYARVVTGLLHHFADDRQAARENVWVLRHLFALAIYAEELKHVPSADSPVFASSVPKATLQGVVDKVQQIATYLLSSTAQEFWHTKVINTLLGQSTSSELEGAGQLVVEVVERAKRQDNVRSSRILHMILQHALSNATKTDADQWMLVARKIEKLAIVYSVTRYAPEPPRLDRFRNELAAGTLGIPASKANTEGLWLLRNLAAAAPDPESDVIFLPQTRAVNLVKACQQWITSDEDLDEEVQSEMTLVFAHLAPILQSVPGAHWDLIFDILENNLENSSFADSSTYVILSRTLRLFIVIEDIVATNKALRAVWEERREANLTLIRDLVSAKLATEQVSTPLSVCRELALQIVQDLPSSLITRDTLSKMCHLLTDGSINVQRMAYQLLQEAAKKYTEDLVIEAAVDVEGVMKVELPVELLDMLQRNLSQEDTDEHSEEWLGYLLTWMVTLDLFTNASLKVKSGYVDQLRDLALVGERLLPTTFTLLNLYGGMAKAFKLEIWDVDEFFLDYYSADSPISLRLLTAHVYYRALLLLPSLIRSWLADCRDRQLYTAVASYTSKHFSPALIRTELARVRDPDVTAELSGENISIKVASAVNEVTASFTVDEQQLELTVKLPADWPLHTIEVKESKHVGVAEDRWRAWELGVQQILTFRSGSIVDGLSFFLKNVTSHFEGIAECAICYSVVNATDGSLPRKPCKTCKNRFHAACLYKWFNTSHSSSCPLCRSEIMTGR
ncbi:hypothetical protein BN946_scf184774.g2 [Trametes cinnabarina]|uniref:E3 ubiquitin-protein ligase listerin n=1 Tax=Pycnoporus cinnabarinus TaxID=5643 RepID=A0A060SD10_PYCCI|nr:hypothetical protein BN946_scf184774.g2 [Trametes cinnabarina]